MRKLVDSIHQRNPLPEFLNEEAISQIYFLTKKMEDTLEIAKFVSFVIKLGLLLAFAGQLKYCTLIMMGLSADKTQKGIMSYSKYSRQLTGQ